MSDSVRELTDDNYEQVFEQASKSLVLDFWTSWCPPCKTMEPVFEDVADELADRAEFARVNADLNPQLADRFDVNGLPAFLLVVDGEEKKRLVGAQTPNQLEELVECER